MKPVLFISDLHLSEDRPEINRLFSDFLKGRARAASALYILGDLFEYWAGDDDCDDAFNAGIVRARSRARYGPGSFREVFVGSPWHNASFSTGVIFPPR